MLTPSNLPIEQACAPHGHVVRPRARRIHDSVAAGQFSFGLGWRP